MTRKSSLWDDLFNMLSKPEMEYLSDITLKYLEGIGMLEEKQKIIDFSFKVEKQYDLEKKYLKILDKVKNLKINLEKYKKTFLMVSIDDII